MGLGKKSVCKHKNRHINQQLLLTIRLNDEATFDDFCWSDNNLLQEKISNIINKNQPLILYIWGKAGAGKSHLLQACCHALGNNSMYLPLKLLKNLEPQIIDGLENKSLVAIDDINEIALNHNWEEAVFHLFNRIRDNEINSLIITDIKPPGNLAIKLADLKSRLCGSLILELSELNDSDKIKTLCMHAKKRGINLSTTVGNFLLSRCTRSMIGLHTILDKLDEASLREKRKLTVPFVKEILDL